jgi:hypothetical protein
MGFVGRIYRVLSASWPYRQSSSSEDVTGINCIQPYGSILYWPISKLHPSSCFFHPIPIETRPLPMVTSRWFPVPFAPLRRRLSSDCG